MSDALFARPEGMLLQSEATKRDDPFALRQKRYQTEPSPMVSFVVRDYDDGVLVVLDLAVEFHNIGTVTPITFVIVNRLQYVFY